MIDIDIKLDISSIKELKAVFENKLTNFSDILNEIGVYFLRVIDLNFLAQGRPNKWKQSLAAILRNGQTLMDTGKLRASVTVKGEEGNIWKVTKDMLTIGSNLQYAYYMHEGTANNPPRPFLVIPEDDLKIAVDLFQNKLLKDIK